MVAVGLDGFRNGWVAVSIDGRKRQLCFLESITGLLRLPYDMAMIDMPIGLPQKGYRDCDLEAQRTLGENGSRVFTGARRPLLGFENRSEAHRWFKDQGEPGVSCQLWCLTKKMKEIDEFMSLQRQEMTRETHPELVFQRLNKGRPLAPKKTSQGLRERRDLIHAEGFTSINEWITVLRIGTGAKADDVLDACACAIAARDLSARLPYTNPPADERGLKMEMWF